MKISSSNPSVAPYVKQDALAYAEAGMLDHFYTSFFSHPEYPLSKRMLKLLPQLGRELGRRSFNELDIKYIKARPWPELLRSVSARKFGPVMTDRIWEWAETGFDSWVAAQLTNSIEAVHCYEHAALATIKRSKELGIFSIYEQPSQHHSFFTPIATRQMELYPELKTGQALLLVDDKATRRNQRRDEELRLADMVFCNSSFTRRTLVEGGVPEGKISVLPYGFPPVKITRSFEPKNKVIFLNAGTQNLRKALHLLYEAWRQCDFTEDQAELWLIGKMTLPESLRKGLPGKVVIKESVPHSELMEIYNKVDVFVLPTLADGFGMVISEAMSRGIPVISTENSGGPDIIDPEKEGWIIPAGEIQPLIDKLKWCVANKDILPAVGKAAAKKAEGWQWSDFRKALPKLIQSNFQNWKNND